MPGSGYFARSMVPLARLSVNGLGDLASLAVSAGADLFFPEGDSQTKEVTTALLVEPARVLSDMVGVEAGKQLQVLNTMSPYVEVADPHYTDVVMQQQPKAAAKPNYMLYGGAAAAAIALILLLKK